MFLGSDKHESVYKVDFLLEFNYQNWKESRRLRPLLWRGDEVNNRITKIKVDKFLNTVDGAKAVFQSLLDYGVALVENVIIL